MVPHSLLLALPALCLVVSTLVAVCRPAAADQGPGPDVRIVACHHQPGTVDDEAREIRRLEQRAQAYERALSGVLWTLIHTADEKHKIEAFQAINSVERFDENDRCDLATAIHRAGGVAAYRRQITVLLKNDDVAVRACAAVLLGVLGDPNSTTDLIGLVRAKTLPVADSVSTGTDRGSAATALGMLGAKQYAPELAQLLRDDNGHVRAGAARNKGVRSIY